MSQECKCSEAVKFDILLKGGHLIDPKNGVSAVRDVAIAPDGAIWLAEDANPGGLYRVTPK